MSTDTRGLTPTQLGTLLSPLDPGRVRSLQGNSHLEAWDVRRWLNRIFGFGGWSDTILSCDLVHESMWPVTDPKTKEIVPGKHRCTAVYRVTLRLTIKDVHGNEIGSWDDGATGDSVNQPSVGDAHDMALKTAMSQALKRCAANLGDQFGLSLYNKGPAAAVVVRTLGHPAVFDAPADAAPDAPVVGGDLDAPIATEEHAEAVDVQRTQAVASAGTRTQRTHVPVPEPAPSGPRMSDLQQQQMMAILFKEKLNADQEEKLRVVSGSLGREVTTTKQMTYGEAQACLDWLRNLPDFAPTAATDGLFHQFEAGIKGSASVPELQSVATGISTAFQAGKLTEADRKVLIEVWTERNKVLLDQQQMAGAAA